jgi:hypothetical protein
MKKGIVLFALLMVMIGVQAQGNLPDKVENIKEKLDPATIAGIQVYNTDELIKKMKVRKPEDKLAVSNLIRNYNNSQETLKANNSNILGKFGTDLFEIVKGKDFKEIFGSASDYKSKLNALRTQSDNNLGEFETKLFEVTKKKQQKKYYKYKSNLTKEAQKSMELGDVFSLIGL